MRIEPPVSVPMPTSASPKATDTAAPDDEPPGTRACAGSAGLAGVPWCGLMPTPENANSLILVLPSTTAPASRKRCTTGASCSTGASPAHTTPPAIVVSPATSMLSLRVMHTPCNAPRLRPACVSASQYCAVACAASAWSLVNTCCAAGLAAPSRALATR